MSEIKDKRNRDFQSKQLRKMNLIKGGLILKKYIKNDMSLKIQPVESSEDNSYDNVAINEIKENIDMMEKKIYRNIDIIHL